MSKANEYLNFTATYDKRGLTVQYHADDALKKEHTRYLFEKDSGISGPKIYRFSFSNGVLIPSENGINPFIIKVVSSDKVEEYPMSPKKDIAYEGTGDGHICGCPACRPCS